VATRLLQAACQGFASQGVRVVKAYPRRDASSEAGHYHGPLAMYLKAGFEEIGEAGGIVTVRKSLLPLNA
jgi:hypothetical protein